MKLNACRQRYEQSVYPAPWATPKDIALLDQLPRDRRYDIIALLPESREPTDNDPVDGSVSERQALEADAWGETYFPEEIRKFLEEQ